MAKESPLPQCACQRCGHRWVPRIRHPVQCPRCKSARWQERRTRPKRPRVPQNDIP